MSSAGLLHVCASVLVSAGLLLSAGSLFAREAGNVVDGRTILKMGKGSDLCALTFDDGPGPHTGRLMEILRERGVRATFFLVGKQIGYYPDLVVRLRQEGHEIGNHTQSHRSLRHLPAEEQRAEIVSVQDALRKLGVECRYIRPPYGNYDAVTVNIAREEGADIMLWSIDSMDWSRKARIETMKTLFAGQKLRGIFLFHDTHAQTVDAMPEILDRLMAEGCRFVTVSEYLSALRGEEAAPVAPVDKEEASPPAPVPLVRPDDAHEVRQPFVRAEAEVQPETAAQSEAGTGEARSDPLPEQPDPDAAKKKTVRSFFFGW